jgi:hypothetical protein
MFIRIADILMTLLWVLGMGAIRMFSERGQLEKLLTNLCVSHKLLTLLCSREKNTVSE